MEFLKEHKYDSFKSELNSLPRLYLETNVVLFFDLDNNVSLNSYIAKNFNLINQSLNYVKADFIHLSDKILNLNELNSVISYHFPHFTNTFLGDKERKKLFGIRNTLGFIKKWLGNKGKQYEEISGVIKSDDIYSKVLESLGYFGNIRTGFLVLLTSSKIGYVIEYADSDRENKDIPITDIINLLQKEQKDSEINGFEEVVLLSECSFELELEIPYSRKPSSSKKLCDDKIEEDLDEDVLKKIISIEKKVKELKKSGQLFLALPLLEKILKEKFNEISLNSLSDIYIDSEYRILLPDFNNLEVPLSHLTKVVYILFCNHPEGIDLRELPKYKEEIKNLYLSVSNRYDYDKITTSVDELLNLESKAIYTHISRIKSTFCKLMSENFAKHYIIEGKSFGSTFKYIPKLYS